MDNTTLLVKHSFNTKVPVLGLIRIKAFDKYIGSISIGLGPYSLLGLASTTVYGSSGLNLGHSGDSAGVGI